LKAHFSDETIELMRLHYRGLSEKDRRQYAGLEALKIGKGGIGYISSVLRIGKNNVIRGKRELLAIQSGNLIGTSRQRLPGGGRKKNGTTSANQGIT